MAQKASRPIIYSAAHEQPKGYRFSNPKWFEGSVDADVPMCIVVGSFPRVVEAYKAVGIPVFEVGTLNDALALDAARAKPDFAEIAESLTGAPAASIPPPNDALAVVPGPGGKLFVAKGNDILSGPFDDEEAANAALANEQGEGLVPGAIEPPVEIPDAWRDLPWPELRSLAAKISDKPVITADDAIFAIEFEIERRKEAVVQ